MTEPFVLAVSNRKGGSGKTTTSVNLAAEWASRGLRTLVVDLDTQGHAGFGLGISPAKGAPTAHDIFRAPGFHLSSAVSPTAWPNLWCAPADFLYDGTGGNGNGGIGNGGDAGLLSAQLRDPRIRDAYDIIVLDTPPSLDRVLLNAMAAADGVLIPMLPHALSAEGVKQLARLFYRVASSSNTGLKVIGLLPVMASARINHHRGVIADVTKQFGPERVLRGIRADIQLAEAFAARRPIRAHAPRGRGALDHSLLADELGKLWRWPDGRPVRPQASAQPIKKV